MQHQDFELQWIIAVIRRWWWLIAIMAILAAGAAYAVTRMMPPVYEATATLLISPAQNSSTIQYSDLIASERLALTYSQMLKQHDVLSVVKTKLGLAQSTGELAAQIDAQPVASTQLIKITVSDNDPDQAAVIANTVAQVFKDKVDALAAERYATSIKNAQERVGNFQNQVTELEGQVEQLRLQKVAKEVTLANQQAGLDTLRKDYQALQNNQQQTELSIAEATGDIYVFEPVQVKPGTKPGTSVATAVISVGQIQSIGGTTSTNVNGTLTYGRLIIKTSLLQNIIKDVGLNVTPEDLSKRITIESVAGTQLIRLSVDDTDAARVELTGGSLVEAFIAQVKTLLSEPYADRLANIQTQLDETKKAIDTAQNDNGKLTEEISQLGADIDRQNTALAENRTDLRTAQKDLETVRITAAESSDSVVVSDPAQTPKSPSQNRLLYVALAGLVGATLGLALVFLLEFLDNRIRTDQDVRSELGLPVIGTIGRFGREAGELVMSTQPTSPVSDDFRALSRHIYRLFNEQKLRTILITSPTPMAGKSVVVSNLSLTLAKSGLKVIAIDADLRLPRLHKIFGLKQDIGLASILSNGSMDGCLQYSQNGKINVLTSGGVPPNPVELLSSPFLRKVVGEFCNQADIVLIDCPPVLTTTDPLVLADVVDGVVIVLKAGQSEQQSAKRTIEALQQAKANLVGVVLNEVSTRKDGYYRYYRDAGSRS